MKKIIFTIIMIATLCSIVNAKTLITKDGKTMCMDDNGKYAISAFRWYDDNNDGFSELYYFDDTGVLLNDDSIWIGDYLADKDGKLYNPELGNKYLQIPNEYVNDTYYLLMKNPQDINEAKIVYNSHYESIEKYVNKYVNDVLAKINILGTGATVEGLKEEALAEIPAFTYGLLASDIYVFYKNDDAQNEWRKKIDNLRKTQMAKIQRIR